MSDIQRAETIQRIELIKMIGKIRRDMPYNKEIMEFCSDVEKFITVKVGQLSEPKAVVAAKLANASVSRNWANLPDNQHASIEATSHLQHSANLPEVSQSTNLQTQSEKHANLHDLVKSPIGDLQVKGKGKPRLTNAQKQKAYRERKAIAEGIIAGTRKTA